MISIPLNFGQLISVKRDPVCIWNRGNLNNTIKTLLFHLIYLSFFSCMAMHATHAVALCPTGGAHSSKITGLKVITETIQSFSDKWYSVASVEPKGGWRVLAIRSGKWFIIWKYVIFHFTFTLCTTKYYKLRKETM